MILSLEKPNRDFANWLDQAWQGSKCGLYEGATPRLLPTCFAILAAECVGILDQISEEKKQALIKEILVSQDASTGLFKDGNVTTAETSSHRPDYIYMQHTYFALHALNALGQKPYYKLSIAERFISHEYLRGWLDAGPWEDPWLHSNNVMFALSFLQHEYSQSGDASFLQSFDFILDYLDRRQDPNSGLWQPEGGQDNRNAVFAAYHFFPFYFWRGRQPGYVEQIIDTTLGIQSKDGFYISGGGACEDLDAVHTLIMMTLVSDHRAEDICHSLLRCANSILASQQTDGGYRNYSWNRRGLLKKIILNTNVDLIFLNRELVPRSWQYSGWKPLSCPRNQSDMWSAWFRPLSLLLISELYPDQLCDAPKGNYRAMPGLGWHNPEQIKKSSPKKP